MSEQRRQHLANLALRSPNLGAPASEPGEVGRLRYQLAHARGQEAYLRQQLTEALDREHRLRGVVVQWEERERQRETRLALAGPPKKPGIRFTAFIVWAVLSAGLSAGHWGWGPLATLFSAWVVASVTGRMFER